jgi:ferredoxin
MLHMFYFSGTGNARNVAHWVAGSWREHGRESRVVDISEAESQNVTLGPEDELGLASPTHGFNFPPITLRFIARLPPAPNHNRAFVLNTRAGVRLLGLCLPGLTGAALWFAAALLVLKGYRIAGLRPIDLPSNWLSLHPGLSKTNVGVLYERGERTTKRFARAMLDGQRDRRVVWDLPIDLLLAPLALGYYFVGRYLFAKSFVASRDCDGCGICTQQCPVQAIQIIDGRPFWSHRCESCMRCMNLCPRRAVETAHGAVIGFLLLLSAGLTAWVYPTLRAAIPVLYAPGLLPSSARFAVKSALVILLLMVFYRGLHYALRLPLVERMVVLSSLTHFRFWRRYRAPHVDRTGNATTTGTLTR